MRINRLHASSSLLFKTIFLYFLLLAITINSQENSKTFSMAFGYDPRNNSQYNFLNQLYTETFKRLNIRFMYEVMPLRRCSIETNQGFFNGEPLRVKDYAKSYPNMVIVNESIFRNHVIAYSANDITLTNWDSLNGSSYHIDYVSGSIQTENQLKKRVNINQIFPVKTPAEALQRLISGRSDLFIDLEARVDDYISDSRYQNTNIHAVCIIDQHDAYPFVYKDKSYMIEDIEKAIREIKKDGTYFRILKNTMPSYFERYYN